LTDNDGSFGPCCRDVDKAYDSVMNETDWDEVSYVISSRYRVETMRRLSVGPATPSAIASAASVSLSHVSRALQELSEKSLVTLKVSEDRTKGRVYALTDDGEAIWQTIESENMD
jgi:DNA-binding MarR family transcriptional regulator